MTRTTIKRHVLPGEQNGDTAWFYRQNGFEQQEIFRQVLWKRRRWPGLEDGSSATHPDYTYPHILPSTHLHLAFYEPMAEAILAHLHDQGIALHTEAANLKSSQAACLNFLFPLHGNLDLARAALRPFLPGLREVIGIEFEYTGPEEATEWLDEPSRGKRGQNRTSIDAAISWIGKSKKRWMTLVEWKYTERSFGTCSAFGQAGTTDRSRCESLDVTCVTEPGHGCLLTAGGDYRSRRYWEHIEAAGISLSTLGKVRGCPFQGPFYQLMRQFLLAVYLRETGQYDHVEVACIGFARNAELHSIPPQLRPLAEDENSRIIDAWNAALNGVPKMRYWTAEQLMARVNRLDNIDLGWRNYARERYDV